MTDFAGTTRHNLPPAAELAALIRSGVPLAEAGSRYGCTARSVQTRLNEAGYTRAGDPQTLPKMTPRPNQRPGRLRDRLMPADADMPCRTTEGVEVFAAVIEWYTPTAIKRAKAICARCPFRSQCLAVHGRDYELGVVAGKTDRERKAFFKDSAA